MDDDWYNPTTPPSSGSSSSSNDNNVSLTITPETSGSINTKVGETAYSNNIVSIKGDNVKSYSLSISYDTSSANLSHADDSSITIGNVASSGVVGSNLDSNTWSWGWSDNTNTNSNTMTYKPLLTGDGNIVKGAAAGTVPNNTLDTEGKLSFAVKFGEDMPAGHYTASVKLALVIEPAEVAGIEYKLIYDINNMHTDSAMTKPIIQPSTQTCITTETSHTFTISSQTYPNTNTYYYNTKDGCPLYFAGWATSTDGNVYDITLYKPSEQITLDSNQPVVTLYARGRGAGHC